MIKETAQNLRKPTKLWGAKMPWRAVKSFSNIAQKKEDVAEEIGPANGAMLETTGERRKRGSHSSTTNRGLNG